MSADPMSADPMSADPMSADPMSADPMTPDQLAAFRQQTAQTHKPSKPLKADGHAVLKAADDMDRAKASARLLAQVEGLSSGSAVLGHQFSEKATSALSGIQEQVRNSAQPGEANLSLFLQQRLEMLKFGGMGHGAQDAAVLNANQGSAGLLAATSAAGNLPASLEQAAKLESKGGSSESSWMMAGRAQLDSAQTVQGASASDSGMMSDDEHHVAEDLKFWASRNIQNAEFKLEGWEDASVQVRVSLQGSSANVEFLTDHADSRAMLANSQDELKQLLEQQGLMLSGVSVGGSMSQPSTSERFGNSGSAPSARVRPAGLASSGAELTASLGENIRAVKPGQGAVDLYV